MSYTMKSAPHVLICHVNEAKLEEPGKWKHCGEGKSGSGMAYARGEKTTEMVSAYVDRTVTIYCRDLQTLQLEGHIIPFAQFCGPKKTSFRKENDIQINE